MREIRVFNSDKSGIIGVSWFSLNQNHDERGWLMEIVRSSNPFFQNFGQLYLTTTYNNAIKAWHEHKMQTDHICCIKGMIKFVMVDTRMPDNGTPIKDTTHGNIIELFIGEKNPTLVIIPPGVVHGWKAYDNETAYILNIPSREYDHKNPDELRYSIDREFVFGNYGRYQNDFLTPKYKYDWSRIDR